MYIPVVDVFAGADQDVAAAAAVRIFHHHIFTEHKQLNSRCSTLPSSYLQHTNSSTLLADPFTLWLINTVTS